jgi:hypothetical protein
MKQRGAVHPVFNYLLNRPGAGDFEINRKKSATEPLAVLRLHWLLPRKLTVL